jgi:hypothetical protein
MADIPAQNALWDICSPLQFGGNQEQRSFARDPAIAASLGGSMRQGYTLLTLVGTFALAVAGCSADSTNENSPPEEEATASGAKSAATADPCSFVSKEEVAAVIGERIIQAEADDETCRYETDDAMASSVLVNIKQSGGAKELEVVRSATGVLGNLGDDLMNSGGAEGDTGKMLTDSSAAPKIGDQAFFGPNQQLHVLKGDTYFAVSPPQISSRMGGGNPLLPAEKKRELAAAIAQRIAAKL